MRFEPYLRQLNLGRIFSVVQNVYVTFSLRSLNAPLALRAFRVYAILFSELLLNPPHVSLIPYTHILTAHTQSYGIHTCRKQSL